MDQGISYPPPNLMGSNRMLWSLTGANMNTTADQAFVKAFAFSEFSIEKIIVTNASTSLTLAVGGLYGAAAKSAPIIVAAVQVYSALTTGIKILNPTIATAGLDMMTTANIFLALTVGQGGAATADIFIMGYAYN